MKMKKHLERHFQLSCQDNDIPDTRYSFVFLQLFITLSIKLRKILFFIDNTIYKFAEKIIAIIRGKLILHITSRNLAAQYTYNVPWYCNMSNETITN